MEELKNRLLKGVKKIPLQITDEQCEKLLAYVVLFNKWNKAYNLSSVRDISQMVDRHLLDSLSVVKFIEGENIIDVGTGGGLPGIPLAIMFPEKNFTLMDSNGKKTRFLFQVKTELKLNNVKIENCRVESHHPEPLYDIVISRAFASLKDMVDSCQQMLKDDGQFYAMKGIYPSDELSQLGKNYKVTGSHRLQVPGEKAERHLLLLGKAG